MSEKILHVISQDNQPIGSINRSCDECGLAVWNCDEFVSNERDYTKEIAEKNNLVRCADS